MAALSNLGCLRLGLPMQKDPIRGRRGSVQPREIQGQVAASKGSAEPKSPQDERRAGQTRPASLHRRVSQEPEQRNGRGTKPKDCTKRGTNGRAREA
jgi:hypothetical protein